MSEGARRRTAFQLAEPVQLFTIGPKDPAAVDRAVAGMNPAALRPGTQLRRGNSQLLCQVC